MEQRVGSCSLCGGDVYGVRGGWWSVEPPPPDTCRSCGAKRADDVIPMRRVSRREWPHEGTATPAQIAREIVYGTQFGREFIDGTRR